MFAAGTSSGGTGSGTISWAGGIEPELAEATEPGLLEETTTGTAGSPVLSTGSLAIEPQDAEDGGVWGGVTGAGGGPSSPPGPNTAFLT